MVSVAVNCYPELENFRIVRTSLCGLHNTGCCITQKVRNVSPGALSDVPVILGTWVQ